jgi:hypothetical protein
VNHEQHASRSARFNEPSAAGPLPDNDLVSLRRILIARSRSQSGKAVDSTAFLLEGEAWLAILPQVPDPKVGQVELRFVEMGQFSSKLDNSVRKEDASVYISRKADGTFSCPNQESNHGQYISCTSGFAEQSSAWALPARLDVAAIYRILIVPLRIGTAKAAGFQPPFLLGKRSWRAIHI